MDTYEYAWYVQLTDLRQRNKGNTMEQRQFFQQMVLEQLDIHTPKKGRKKKNQSKPGPTSFTKINYKWMLHLSIKHKTKNF